MTRLTTAKRQKMIIDEAINIIHEQGYQAFSIRELASRVEISEPAIYRHFRNKEYIILGILNKFHEFDDMLSSEIENFDDPFEKISHFVLYHFEFLERNRELTSVIFSEEIFTHSKLLRDSLVVVINKRKKILTEIIEESKRLTLIKEINTEELHTIILGYIKLVVFEWRFSDFSFSLKERAQNFLELMEKLIKR